MDRLIFYVFLCLLYAKLVSSAELNITSYASPSIVLSNKLIVGVGSQATVVFANASSLNKDSKTIQYQILDDTPNILVPRVVVSKDNDKLFLFGINGDDNLFHSTVLYSFDIKDKIWRQIHNSNIPVGILQYQEEQFVGPDNEGNAYLFYTNNNAMLTFNTETLKWKSFTFEPITPAGYLCYTWYTSTLLPDGKIIYIGGKFIGLDQVTFSDSPMDEVKVYDTKINVWSNMPTNGIIPGPRNSHTSSLTSDGRIIVYGGVNTLNQAASPALAVLDITGPNYSWSSPQVTNPIAPVFLGSSVMVENFMILYTGSFYDIEHYFVTSFDKISMLDTQTYTWYTLDPTPINEDENIYKDSDQIVADRLNFFKNRSDTTFILMIVLVVFCSLFTLLILGTAIWYKLRR